MEPFGIGPIIACHQLAEIGSALRFCRSRQVVRLFGLDPVVEGCGDRRRPGKLAKQGASLLRGAVVEAHQHGRRINSTDGPHRRRPRHLRSGALHEICHHLISPGRICQVVEKARRIVYRIMSFQAVPGR